MSRDISVIGLRGSGKTTVAQYIDNKLEGMSARLSFATPLKELVMKITPDGKIDKTRDRALLQFLGTEYFRDTINQNYWIDQMGKKYKEIGNLFHVIVDDCRFRNEQILLRELGFVEILVERPGLIVKDTGISGHASEALDLDFDGVHRVINDGSLEDLYGKVDEVLKNL